MVDSTESLIQEIVEDKELESTKPRGKLYPLNSSRLPTDIIKRIAGELDLPGTASRADTYPMLEGKLVEIGREPRNVQVRLTVDEDSSQSIELVDAEGAFLLITVPAEDGSGSEPGEERDGDVTEGDEHLRTQLDEACSLNEHLQREVSELKIRLTKADTRVKELWAQQCTLLTETDAQLAEAEAEIEHLKAASAGRPPSLTRDRESFTVPDRSIAERPCRSSTQRRGKAPPVEPFTGENEAVRVDDWLPSLERAATWNEWAEGDRLLQLAGHLRGRALQEWELISDSNKTTYPLAVKALKCRLDPGSKTLAAQDFRHTVQAETESVGDFIRRLERTFRIAYGRDGISSEARDALLYGQLHEGLRYEIMRAPGVSGVDSYSALCIAAKSEERRLQELRKRQQYQKQATLGTKPPPKTPPPVKDRFTNSYSEKRREGKSTDKRTCFVCDQPGHFANNCPSRRTESRGKNKPGGQKVNQVHTTSDLEPDDLLELLLSDSDGEQVQLVQVRDKGSSAKGATVQIQGVPAVGVLDSGSDLTIIGAELFTKVALAARLHKRDFKKADKTPRTYDQRTFSLDGRLDLDIEFAGKSMNTPVYVRKEAQEQLLLSEGVCRQLGLITYHSGVQPFRQLRKNPHGVGTDAQVPMVRVHLVQSIKMLPHQSIVVPVQTDGMYGSQKLLVESSNELIETTGVHVEDALIDASRDGLTYLILSNPSGVSCHVEENTCLGVVHEVALVDPDMQKRDGPLVNRVESHPPVRYGNVGWREQKLLATVKKPEILNEQQSSEFETFLAQHHDVFSLEDGERGETSLTEMTILTGDSPPQRVPARRMPLAVRREVATQLRDMQKTGVVQPSASAWSSPVVMVKKKDGTQRFCVDYRALNAVTKADTFPLPRIDDLLDQLGNSRFFTTLDLASGYWQIRLSQSSREKTAFAVPHGLFEFQVMPFGLTNAPGVFQRLMQRVLAGLNPEQGPDFVKVYIDDILVFSPSLADHLDHLQQVLSRIRNAGLKLKPSKCHFIAKEVQYLGHLLTPEGLKTNLATVSAVKEFPQPTNVKEVRQFLGLSSFYRRFIKGFATVAHPLHQLTRKGVHFRWSPECQEAFAMLKELLTSSPVLTYPRVDEPFVLETDASILGLGAILSQSQDDGQTHPVAYASRSLNKAERNYGITELETLAVVWAATHFRAYLYRNKVTVYTDHSSVKAVLQAPNPSGKHARWWTRVYGSGIQEVKIVYRPGKQCANADALSRSPLANTIVEAEDDSVVTKVTATEVESSGTITELLTADPEVSGVTSSFGSAQRKDANLVATFKFLEEQVLPEDPVKARKIALQAPLFAVVEAVLYHLDLKPSCRRRIVVPKQLTKGLLDKTHRSQMGGHFSGQRLYNALSRNWWWEGMYTDAMKFAQSCPECLTVKGSGRHQPPPLHPIQVFRPFQIIGVDVMDLPKTSSGNKHVLVFQDYFTKWPMVYAIPDQKAHRIVDILVKEIVPTVGVPEGLLSDRGTNLLSHLMRDVCKALGITKLNTTAYHPQCDGLVERFNRTLKSMLRKHASRYGKEWDRHLYGPLWAYRNTPHESTGEKPSFLLYGRDLRSPVEAELLAPEPHLPYSVADYREQLVQTLSTSRHLAEEMMRKAQTRYKTQFDKKARQRHYQIGDWVMVKFPQEEQGKLRKLSHPWHGPYRVVERRDPDISVAKVYHPQEGNIQVHQERVCFCPPELPAGYFWYGTRRHAIGRPPKWVQALLQKGTVGDPGEEPAESLGDPEESAESLGDPGEEPAESLGDPEESAESLGDPEESAESLGDPGEEPAESLGGDPEESAESLGDPGEEPAESHGDPDDESAESPCGDPDLMAEDYPVPESDCGPTRLSAGAGDQTESDEVVQPRTDSRYSLRRRVQAPERLMCRSSGRASRRGRSDVTK